MAAKADPLIVKQGNAYASLLDSIIERGILFILLFTLLAFGAVQTWSAAFMEIAAFVVLGAWAFKAIHHERSVVACPPVMIVMAPFITVAVIQVIPLPENILLLISQETSRLYTAYAPSGMGTGRTISLAPGTTKEELWKLLAYCAVFVVVINHYRTKEQVRGLIRAVILLGTFVAVFAIIQKLTWNGRLYWFYPVDPRLYSGTDFIWGPFINHNHLAGYLELVIPLAMGTFLYHTVRTKEMPHATGIDRVVSQMSAKRFPRQAFLGLSIVIMTASLFVSLSRGGILGFTGSMMLFFVLMRSRRSLKKSTPALALIGLVVVFTVAAAGWGRIESRFGEIGEEGRIKRFDVWSDTAAMVRDFPVLGTGLGTFKYIYPRYQTKYSTVLFEHAENDYIEVVTEMGIVGILLVLSTIVLFFSSVLRSWRERKNSYVICMTAGCMASCGAIAVHSMTDFNMRVPSNAMLLAVVAGLAYALVFHMSSGREA